LTISLTGKVAVGIIRCSIVVTAIMGAGQGRGSAAKVQTIRGRRAQRAGYTGQDTHYLKLFTGATQGERLPTNQHSE
jgi:hypothetical protein